MSRALVRTSALLLRKTVVRESDALLVLFTQDLGRITAGARGAQRSQKRFGGALEPMHTLAIELAKTRGDNYQLQSAAIARPRFALTQSLQRLEAAGRALQWVRKGAMEHDPEPLVWRLVNHLLDQLDTPGTTDPPTLLAAAGLALLDAWGWGIEFDTCVRCGRACPAGKAAFVEAAKGGLVCSACGGGRVRLEGEQRTRFSMAARTGSGLTTEDAAVALRLVETALGAHADIS